MFLKHALIHQIIRMIIKIVKKIGNEIASISSSPVSLNQFMSILAATVLPIISVVVNALLKSIFEIELG